MAEAPLVSVIIPTYNYARFISEAIESVLGQSYRHFEIVVIDDGSIDDTKEVVARFPEVRYEYQTNQGIAAARNAGLLFSRGDYLVFLDADDRLLPNALEAGVNSLSEQPACAFVSGHWERFSRDKEPLPTSPIICFRENNYRVLLDSNYIGTMGQVMFRRSVLVAEPGFDSSVPGCDDMELYLRLAKDYLVYCHDQIVVQHRVHGLNASGNRLMMLRSMDKIYRRHLELIKDDPELEALCRQGIGFCRKFVARELKRQRREWLKARWPVKQALKVRHRVRADLIFRRYKSLRRTSQE